MSKFAIGDKVRVVRIPPGDSSNANLLGKTGVVFHLGTYVTVTLDGEGDAHFEETEIEKYTTDRTQDTGSKLRDLIAWAVEESAFFNTPESPFALTFDQGFSRVAVVVGENASGKSLLVRCLASRFNDETKGHTISISIRERTATGIERAFIFGDENRHSTGSVSARTVKTAFRQKYNHPWLLVLDEPELGLSEGYAGAMGELIGKSIEGLDPNCVGVLVVTHSRDLVRRLFYEDAGVGFVAMQKAPLVISDWWASEEERSLEDLEKLPDLSHERSRAVSQIMKGIQIG